MRLRSIGFLARIAGVALVALFVSSRAAAEICVDVDVRFTGHHPSRAVVQSMEDEASSIWKPYAVRIQWSTSDSPARCALVQGSFDVLVDHQHRWRATPLRVRLGSTRVLPTIQHAPIYLDYEATERTLGTLMADQVIRLAGRTDPGPADMGRALGRVLAHEMGHVLLGASDHQPHGLMRRVFIAADLIDRNRHSYTLSSAEVARLCQREIDLNASPVIWPW